MKTRREIMAVIPIKKHILLFLEEQMKKYYFYITKLNSDGSSHQVRKTIYAKSRQDAKKFAEFEYKQKVQIKEE